MILNNNPENIQNSTNVVTSNDPSSGNQIAELPIAYFEAEISEFLHMPVPSIVGAIALRHSQTIEHLATHAWKEEVEILRVALQPFDTGHILFEMHIPRMGRRVDVVLIIQNIIFVVEFKTGASVYSAQDVRQCHGYAIDLSNFHDGSHDKIIIPMLVATEAPAQPLILERKIDAVFEPVRANRTNLSSYLQHCINQYGAISPTLDYQTWYRSSYRPSPTIVEAAQALYATHKVQNIARHDAGATNLHATSRAVEEIIADARQQSRKVICFVTGVPGSGKTLVGLNIAALNCREDGELSVFLSGNGPLVEVLTEALVRDSVIRDPSKTKTSARKSVEGRIQNVHRFRDESLNSALKPPPERVVIFDEAQRAWNLHQTRRFMTQKRRQPNFNQSEPDFLISVMDRHEGWCVIVALIGGGQEIGTGEAGLQGWVDAIAQKYQGWDVYYSDKLKLGEYAGKDVDFGAAPHAKPLSSLHLSNSMRSFRAEKQSHVIHHLLQNNSGNASEIYRSLRKKFSIKLTRDLPTAKAWVRGMVRANQTKGLIASSGGLRLKADGIFVKNQLTASDWFLNANDDVRSCHFLEDVATEFDIQGLELDWTLVAWDADLRYRSGKFEHWRFSGAQWKQRKQTAQMRYLENAYRVLLTRARQGIVIYVPRGDEKDPTRLPAFFDETYSYLLRCGFDELEEVNDPDRVRLEKTAILDLI
ncbi:MAG: DUF2075 domain-containing protein [Telluria sp.]